MLLLFLTIGTALLVSKCGQEKLKEFPMTKRSELAVAGIAVLLALPPFGNAAQDSPPSELFAPVGTVLTVQVREHLSSNRNMPGDTFVASLQQPLVIDGWVVARPGQTVMGQVIQANSAGKVKGTSELGIELTEIVLVDGRQVPIRTQLLKNYGRESHNEDASAIAGGTAVGAIIGAAAGRGKGALIGAGIGAAAATVGVLATRGKATEIYPESTMTFRLDAPLVVSTEKTRQAFVAVSPRDYERAPSVRTPARDLRPNSIARAPYPPPYPPSYAPYPRSPRRSGIGAIIPTIVLVAPIVLDHRDRGNHRRRRW
jgi:hypothetical protein